ncbi:hypothetical protein B0I35DRAFT_487559 [Stachybotrys elegans]|uniref:Nephrocystin 3-like N-terminal domain-containing protein n=1 Tax=Stachybotrys elegans TaxID=80388 RepID=A0A8K0T7K2_9HYPO|nr:hypothetical protein B0I35DRAFT_487559 [Stachybotrys elegans]
MNSAGILHARGKATVHIGNVYTHGACLNCLRTASYEDCKNRNTQRAPGTCEWFASHGLFGEWREASSGLLWVSADPGCGKSVLARHLVDDVLPPSAGRTTCYFFFKDDCEDQRTLDSALCCILHEIFHQNPNLLDKVFPASFKEDPSDVELFSNFGKLWELLIEAAKDDMAGEIICILDALDECVDSSPLATALAKLYTKNTNGGGPQNLKFLITSRPYLRIQRDFRPLEQCQSVIHLSGESQEVAEQIQGEIATTIDLRIDKLCAELALGQREKDLLREELTAAPNRTYLWAHLMLDALDDAVFFSTSDLRAKIRTLPHTVGAAYESILRKSKDPARARRILGLVLAAGRPLHLEEVSAMLTFQPDSHNSLKDFESGRFSTNLMEVAIREACGLLLVVQDSYLYFLHQSARQFLVAPPSPFSYPPTSGMKWQGSVDMKKSNKSLLEMCIKFLLLEDWNGPPDTRPEGSQSTDNCGFLHYAASYWTRHYRQAQMVSDALLDQLALQLCDPAAAACQSWLKLYQEDQNVKLDLCNPLFVVAHFGLSSLVDTIVSSQDPKHQAEEFLNKRNGLGHTALHQAAAEGHYEMVHILLAKGADANIRGHDGFTALSFASYHRHLNTAGLLVDHGADVEGLTSMAEVS